MSDRSIGLGFIAIGALFHSARYIAAGAFKAGRDTPNHVSFSGSLERVGSNLLVLAILCAVVGVIYFICGERSMRKQVGGQ